MKARLFSTDSLVNPLLLLSLHFWTWADFIWSAPWLLLHSQLSLPNHHGVVDGIKIVEFLQSFILRRVHLCTCSSFGYGFNINIQLLVHVLSWHPLGRAIRWFIFCQFDWAYLLWQLWDEYRNQRWRFPVNWLISSAHWRMLLPGSSWRSHLSRRDGFDYFVKLIMPFRPWRGLLAATKFRIFSILRTKESWHIVIGIWPVLIVAGSEFKILSNYLTHFLIFVPDYIY